MFQNKMMKLREPVGKTFTAVLTGDVCPKFPEAQEQAINHSETLVARSETVHCFCRSEDHAVGNDPDCR